MMKSNQPTALNADLPSSSPSEHQSGLVSRRALLLAAPLAMAGCVGVPKVASSGTAAQARSALEACIDMHGGAAWQSLRDISVSYDGNWYSIVQRVQPVLVDAQFRKSSQERLIVKTDVMAQQHTGPGGTKVVTRIGQSTKVWYNNVAAADAEVVGSAALVADAYRMFLTAPFMFQDQLAQAEHGGSDKLDGREHTIVLLTRKPGLGWDQADRFALYIDVQSKRLSRVRFTIDALASTRNAVVEVDFAGHRLMHGVLWPTQFFERIRTPLPLLPAHRWWMTGLDINRGLRSTDLLASSFSAAAAAPAQALPPA